MNVCSTRTRPSRHDRPLSEVSRDRREGGSQQQMARDGGMAWNRLAVPGARAEMEVRGTAG